MEFFYFFLGVVAGWLTTHLYYLKQKRESDEKEAKDKDRYDQLKRDFDEKEAKDKARNDLLIIGLRKMGWSVDSEGNLIQTLESVTVEAKGEAELTPPNDNS